MNLMVQFLYFQAMDVLTTMAFLLYGGQEANPLVRFALRLSPSPLLGLVLVKVAALALGVYCWRYRQRTLVRINILFAIVVAWNIAVLIFGVPAPNVVAAAVR